MKLTRRYALASVVAVVAIAGAGYALHARIIGAALPEACITASDEPETPGAGMVFIAENRFMMGSEDYRLEEAPRRQSAAGGILDRTRMT